MIRKTRINNIDKYMQGIKTLSTIHIGVKTEGHTSKVTQLGIIEGESILPKQTLGKASEYNAEGKVIIRRDLNKESYILERPRSVKDRGGHWHSGVSYIEKERYPREMLNPYEVYLHLSKRKDIECIVSDSIIYSEDQKEKIKNTINMFLEIFGECYILTDEFSFEDEVKNNWRIFPPGEYPWERVKELISQRIQGGETKKWFYLSRMDELYKYTPNFRALGEDGYNGYFVLGYSKRGIYIAESCKYGNATYVLNTSREEISKMTKAEVINGNLAIKRIIHGEGRDENIRKLFDQYPEKE